MAKSNPEIPRPVKMRDVKALIAGHVTARELADKHGVLPNLVYRWRREFELLGNDAWPGRGHVRKNPDKERINELNDRVDALEDYVAELEALNAALRTSKTGLLNYAHC